MGFDVNMRDANYEDVILRIGSYYNYPMCLFVKIHSREFGPIANITTNLGFGDGVTSKLPLCTSFIDENNNPGISEFLEKIGLAKPYKDELGHDVTIPSGYVDYKLFKFDENKLEELDPVGYNKYIESYAVAKLKMMMGSSGHEVEDVTEPGIGPDVG